MTNEEQAQNQEAARAQEQLALALKALSVMRHDVRNLLASVTIMAGRMEESGDERLAKAAPLLVASMERAVALGVKAGRLIEASPPAPAPVPLSQALAIADPVGAVAAEGADLAVMADEGQVAVMIEELIANAAQSGEHAATPVRVVAERAGDEVAIRVFDTGTGVADYALADLFTPFKGAKRRDGTGLGLPLAARLARLSGGALALERTGEDGSVFLLTLPAA